MSKFSRPIHQARFVKRFAVHVLLAGSLLTCSFIATRAIHAQSFAGASRVIQGKVYAPTGEVKAGAVVYLKDQKSLEIKTYISTQDGAFRFGQLSSADDYLLWAELGGHKSKNRTVSSFDTKKTFDVSLHIEDK